MANVTETDSWPSGVYQYADGDVLDGGPESSETLPIRQLAARALYQRLRNVTPWEGTLAAAYGYPAGACVYYGGYTWRSKAAGNAAEPGTDATKWERWGFSLTELQALIGSLSLVVDAPQALTMIQREQAQQNIKLPPEHIYLSNGNTIVIAAASSYTTLPLAGAAELQKDGSIARSGNTVVIARAGLYAITQSHFLTANGSGAMAYTAQIYINGTALETSAQSANQDTVSAGLGFKPSSNSVVRLAVGDVVEVKGHQNPGAVTAVTTRVAGLSVTRIAA